MKWGKSLVISCRNGKKLLVLNYLHDRDLWVQASVRGNSHRMGSLKTVFLAEMK